MYILEWPTVSALTRGLFLCLFHNDLYTSSTCLTRSVFVLLMTSVTFDFWWRHNNKTIFSEISTKFHETRPTSLYVDLRYWVSFMNSDPDIYGVVCQEQVSKAGASNYTPQILCDVIICPCLWYMLVIYSIFVAVVRYKPSGTPDEIWLKCRLQRAVISVTSSPCVTDRLWLLDSLLAIVTP